MAFEVASEAMQAEALDVHVLYRDCRVEPAKQANDLVDQVRTQLAAVIIFEQQLEATMPNGSDS